MGGILIRYIIYHHYNYPPQEIVWDIPGGEFSYIIYYINKWKNLMKILCYIMIPILIMSMVLTIKDDEKDGKIKGDT